MDKQKYSDAIDILDSQFAFFVTHVLNIGRPIDSGIISTACVMIEKELAKKGKTDDFCFAFNPQFAETLDVDDYAFVLSHETMHILLNHLNLAGRFPDKVRFNIAADCVINDYLMEGGLLPSDKLQENLMSGMKNVGYNCAHVTVGQVYDDLPDDIVEQMGMGMSIDDHGWIHVPEKYVKDIIDKICEQAEKDGMLPSELKKLKADLNDKSDIKSMYAGSGETGEREFIEAHGVKMDWVNLLKKLHPDIFKMKNAKRLQSSFHARPRKLAAFGDVILPVKKPSKKRGFGDKPVIFMALDTSGSIGDVTARKFITLAKSIPQTEIHLEVITFTDGVRELDLENPKFHSGGTAFSPIEAHIRNKVMPKYKNKYPKSVVVITDGCAAFSGLRPEEENKKRWLWLLEGDYYNPKSCPHLFGEVTKLNEFVK